MAQTAAPVRAQMRSASAPMEIAFCCERLRSKA
jgi:hypothetical protein